MKVVITGSKGFIGKNLKLRLTERSDIEIECFDKGDDVQLLKGLLETAEIVFHFAGVNRPNNVDDFNEVNYLLTALLCRSVAEIAATNGRKVPIVFSSSTHAVDRCTPYGSSKRAAEEALFELQRDYNIPVFVFRLPNVFGKWCKPNYNSVVATFCYNLARGLPIYINDPTVELRLVYIDDVLASFTEIIDGGNVAQDELGFYTVRPQYTTTIGALAELLELFIDSRETLMTERVGEGLTRALYSTYISYLPSAAFGYALTTHRDNRGVFVELLKTPDCGQFSFFTAVPGITRGGHYHHSKTEKFLVVKGRAKFKFRHMDTGEKHELITSDDAAQIIETAPGWTHDITNIGDDEMIVFVWANEVFDLARQDTFPCPV